MKKLFTVLAAALMISVSASAQHEIGGIVGGLYGASYKYWFNDNVALQADLAVGLTQAAGRQGGYSWNNGFYDFTVNPNAMYHWELPMNFKVYAGGGASFGLVSPLENTASEGINGKFGLNAIGGVSYDFDAVPLVIAFDFRPGYGLAFWGEKNYRDSGSLSYFDWKIAVAVRYKL